MREFLEYRVADAMTYHPVTVGRHDTLGEVERLLEEHDFDGLPVTEDGALLGLVTKLDLLAAMVRDADVLAEPVEAVMTRRPVTVCPQEPLTRALQLMVETRCRSFPVTIGALLLGMVARRDVARMLRRAAAGGRPGGRTEGGHGRTTLHA